MDDLAAALWGSTTFPRVLAAILDQPDRDFALAGLVAATGADRESVHRALRRAVAAGLVTRRKVGSQFRYAADRSSPFFGEMRSLAAKTYGLQRMLTEALVEAGPPTVDAAFIFGSQATGRSRASSDIDVMVIGTATRFDLARILADVKQQVERPINALGYPPSDVERRLREGDAFFLEVWASPKTMLVGTETDLPGVEVAGGGGGLS